MTLFDDVRFSVRSLSGARQSTFSVMFVLAVVLGISTCVFAIVNAMTRGLPVRDAHEIVSLSSRDSAGRRLGVSYLDFQDWRRLQSVIGAGAFSQATLTLAEPTHPTQRIGGAFLSAGSFETLGNQPVLGRTFGLDDDRPGAPLVAVLGFEVWNGRYGGDADVIGRAINVNGASATIVGVMAEGFGFPVVAGMWLPLNAMPGLTERGRDARDLQVFGRLADNATLTDARAELQITTEQLSREYPATNEGIGGEVEPFPGPFAPRSFLLALESAVLFLLLAAVMNVANASLQRALGRSGQFAMHAALGASRLRLARRVIVENVLLAAIAGLLAFGVAVMALSAFSSSVAGVTFPYYLQWTMDARVVGFLFAATLGTGVLSGAIPATYVFRSNLRFAEQRANMDEAPRGRSSRRWAVPLLVTELAATLVLLATAGLMMRSFLEVYRADSVIDASSLLETRINLLAAEYPTPEQRVIFYDQLEQRMAAIPGVESVGIATAAPYGGAGRQELQIDGRPEPSEADAIRVSAVAVGSTYFSTLGLQTTVGRPLNADDGRAGSATAVINQRLAALHFPNGDTLGQRIRVGALPEWLTIVGVSRTLRQQFFQELDPVVYVPLQLIAPQAVTLLVRPRGDVNVASAIRQEIRAINSNLASSAVTSLNDRMVQSRWGHRVLGNLFTVFALCALMLCALGLYATSAYAVTRRTKEIGIRLAIGAKPGDIARLFLRGTVVPLIIGLAGGLVGALWVGQLLRAFLIQTQPADPVTLMAIVTVLVVTVLLASFFPARRGARLDPVVTLRSE